MKKLSFLPLVLLILAVTVTFNSGCKKTEDPIKYPTGTFPDSIYNLSGLNSQYDDYNSTIYMLGGGYPIIFSSNRGSSGGQFDLVQGFFEFNFDQTTGAFGVTSNITSNAFYSSLISSANTTGNEFGPLGHFSSLDGYEYLLFASQNAGGPLDLYYLKHLPQNNDNMPVVNGPFPIKVFNTPENDAYISFDINEDSAYFSSDRNGKYDIFLHEKPSGMALDVWLNQNFASSTPVDSINSDSIDICPYVNKNVMLFSSNRLGGIGGYDLYYSIFKNGKWNSPVNLGPTINSSSDEYRPIFGYHQDFTNYFLIFSSNRPLPGKTGFDLYFTGLTIPN
jgi:hypothetical protein